MVGKTLGHYEILEPLGAGGMGEVYRARDTKLDRDVAIKVLPEDFATDRERLARFTREAKLLATLNHPNIAAIYGLEDEGDTRFIAMELVEGETLADRIARSGRMDVEVALDIARQIAEALETAHENGVIHRDLKPANVIVTADGKAKVLDFGLAKAYLEEGPASDVSSDLSSTPTRLEATGAGVVLGTAAYMSPEQAKGEPIDKRSDIFAFGAVLYEMLSGRRPFQGESASETTAAILRDEPDWAAVSGLPSTGHALLRRCLRKDPNRRLRDIGDARIEIEETLVERFPSDVRATAETATNGAGIPLRLVVFGGVLIAAVAALTTWTLIRWSPPPGVSRNGPPVVILMDTPAPRGVYDADTRSNSGTNADDLNDGLRDLPVVLHKETVGSAWDREDQILQQGPDLILIHRSAFFHSLNLEIGIGYPPFEDSAAEPDPERISEQERYDHLYRFVDNKLVAFLGYIGAGNPATKFLVYSRGGHGWDEEEGRNEWVAGIEGRFPSLQGRVFTMQVPVGPNGATFRDPATLAQVRGHVESILALDESAASSNSR